MRAEDPGGLGAAGFVDVVVDDGEEGVEEGVGDFRHCVGLILLLEVDVFDIWFEVLTIDIQ